MAAIRFDIYNPAGGLEVEDAMMPAPVGADPYSVAEQLISDPNGGNIGWRIVLWYDVNLVGDRGNPDVDLVVT